ncbi:MAG TPA: hypothetical protein VNW92_07910, partial [Polyangiaceae bacterium]|nr:hypothetical protein [Polyangiaceae bacterium]
MICINCHGPNADSLGRQADTLQNLTGGVARVANFRYGLFNPALLDDPYDKPDLGALTNRQRVFGSVATDSVSVDDWGSRYLSWMALGGTGITIPQIILDQVARTDVGGVIRNPRFSDDLSANMLQVAQLACRAVLAQGLKFDVRQAKPELNGYSPLIVKNGDAELWTQLCSLHNSGRVHKILVSLVPFNVIVESAFFPATPCDENGQPASCYPADANVGDERGRIVTGLHPENSFPWCLDPYTSGASVDELNAFAAQNAVNGTPLPICPPSWASTAEDVDAEVAWENRGAINAGLSVFKFLDKFIKGEIKHIGYDQCDLLTTQ